MNKALLRENARIVRTLQGELRTAHEAAFERTKNEWYEKLRAAREKGEPLPGDDAETKIHHAESSLLANLTKVFFALTEELAGDLDQDLR
ncbi:hypothetical protein [Mycobacterium sp. URHB0021]|jgi:hypothetical protein